MLVGGIVLHAGKDGGGAHGSLWDIAPAWRRTFSPNGVRDRSHLPIAASLKAWPLFDCVMPCAGGEGFLVMSRQRARRLGLRHAEILSTIEHHNAFPEDPIQMRGGWPKSSARQGRRLVPLPMPAGRDGRGRHPRPQRLSRPH